MAVPCVSIEHCSLQSTLHLSLVWPYMTAGEWIGWIPMVSLGLRSLDLNLHTSHFN